MLPRWRVVVKNPPANAGDIRNVGSIPGSGRFPKWQPTTVFLAGISHGQRSLAGYIVRGVTKSRTRLKGLGTHGNKINAACASRLMT